MMIANLLEDRFKMVTRTETREMPVYNLVLARSDRRLAPSLKGDLAGVPAVLAAPLAAIRHAEPVPPALAGSNGCGEMRNNIGMASFSGVEMAAVAGAMTPWSGRTVIDKTGLTGQYDYTLKWAPEGWHRRVRAIRAAGWRVRTTGQGRHRSHREADARLGGVVA